MRSCEVKCVFLYFTRREYGILGNMRYIYTLASVLLTLTPVITFAQTRNIQSLFGNIIEVLGSVVIPFLWGIAFLMFVWNAVRYFVIEGHSEDGREKAKSLMIWGVTAFVFVSIFWGIINMLTQSSGLTGDSQPCSDYTQRYNPERCTQILP